MALNQPIPDRLHTTGCPAVPRLPHQFFQEMERLMKTISKFLIVVLLAVLPSTLGEKTALIEIELVPLNFEVHNLSLCIAGDQVQ